LTVENTEDNHLEEAAKNHSFENEDQKQAWLRKIKELAIYCDKRYDQFGNEKPQDYLSDLDDQYHFKTIIGTD
jgi:hypothetical protein